MRKYRRKLTKTTLGFSGTKIKLLMALSRVSLAKTSPLDSLRWVLKACLRIHRLNLGMDAWLFYRAGLE